MEKFTSGEWAIGSYDTFLQIEDSEGFPICEVESLTDHGTITPRECELANAHLIAAAPKMYRFLKSELEDGGNPRNEIIEALLAEARGE